MSPPQFEPGCLQVIELCILPLRFVVTGFATRGKAKGGMIGILRALKVCCMAGKTFLRGACKGG